MIEFSHASLFKDLEPFAKAMYLRLEPFLLLLIYQVLATVN